MHRIPLLLLVLSAGELVYAADAPAGLRHVPNFDKVSDRIYRGGQPGPIGLQELATMGIKRVIDLRENGEAEQAEEHQAHDLKMVYVHIPMNAVSAPTRAQVEQALRLLDDSGEAPLFLHCRRGKDRTGTVIACYRMQHDGWTNQHALREAQDHGMSSLERGMRSFILHFTPSDTLFPGLKAASPPGPLLH